MIEQISEVSPVIRLSANILKGNISIEQLRCYELIDQYLDDYCAGMTIDHHDVVEHYMSFVNTYLEDVKRFQQTAKYPFEFFETKEKIDRLTYDLFLIVSCLVTMHRFSIMWQIFQGAGEGGRCLVIGAGSGLELNFLANRYDEIETYDLKIADFVRQRFPDCGFHEESYMAHERDLYDAVYAIELLEHLSDPLQLLTELKKSLAPSGELIVTTAKDVPQFDHLYNFTSEDEFEESVRRIGLEIAYKNRLPHQYLLTKLSACNFFYRLQITQPTPC